jgi:hypothetical protein
MNAPSWMKPHLRQRLEQERKEATRTGPVNGEKALTAENGKVKEVVTNHKPLPPKNGLDDDAPELGQEFFDRAIVTKPGESLIENVLAEVALQKGLLNLYGNRWREEQENRE